MADSFMKRLKKLNPVAIINWTWGIVLLTLVILPMSFNWSYTYEVMTKNVWLGFGITTISIILLNIFWYNFVPKNKR